MENIEISFCDLLNKYLVTINWTMIVTISIFHWYTGIWAYLLPSLMINLSATMHLCSIVTFNWAKVPMVTEISSRAAIRIIPSCEKDFDIPHQWDNNKMRIEKVPEQRVSPCKKRKYCFSEKFYFLMYFPNVLTSLQLTGQWA